MPLVEKLLPLSQKTKPNLSFSTLRSTRFMDRWRLRRNIFKGQLWEGGIRVPFLVQWKGVLPAGRRFDPPVSALDIVPTVLGAVGAPMREGDRVDGVNLLPFLTGQQGGQPHRFLYWRLMAAKAIRSGDWKLIDEGNEQRRWALFNLAEDIAESKDLAQKAPKKVQQLKDAWEEWNATLPPYGVAS